MSEHLLPISDMSSRHIGLTPAIADCFLEAALVCLDRHHTSPIDFLVQDCDQSISALVSWDIINQRIRNAWANESDATRDGAYSFALAAVELLYNMVAVRRAETLTGADYYVGLRDQAFEDLEDCIRLEVSGIDRGSDADITYRLKNKVAQTIKGQSNLPAIACVVGFLNKKIILQLVENLDELE
jgi:hypothetical protein